MSNRPFRTRPPQIDGAVLRRRVQRVLHQRFDQRVTVVQAGAGFGKTTALAQAVDQNRLLPLGIDVWMGCEPGDVDAGHLLSGFAAAVGLADDADRETVLATLAAHSPTAVCLIVDDVHEITAGSEGAAALAALVDDLPANAGVVLAGRVDPPVALARLEAQGQVSRLGEDDLALTAEEIADMAGDGRAGELDGLGGWPALISLALQARGVRSFLDQEVLRSLQPDQREVLEVVVALGGADAELIGTVLGRDVIPTLRSLPLVHEADGWFEAHDLWANAVEAPAGISTLRHEAVRHLLERGDAAHAVEQCLRTGLDDLLGSALRQAAMPGWSVPIERKRSWLERLPTKVRDLGVGHYLAGLVARDADAGSTRSRDHFATAAERFVEEGDVEAEVLALAALGVADHIRRDTAALLPTGIRLAELSGQGVASATTYALLGEAIVHLAAADPDAMLSTISRIDPESLHGPFPAMADWVRTQALSLAGRPSMDVARRCVEGGVPLPGMSDVLMAAAWREGEIATARHEMDHGQIPDGERDRYLRFIWRAVIATAVGDVDRARRELAAARDRRVGHDGEITDLALRLAEATLALETDGPVDGPAAFAAQIDAFPVGDQTLFWYTAALGHLARYHPATADELEQRNLGPLHRRDLAVGRALFALDRGDLDPMVEAPWPEPVGGVLPAAMLRGACEFVAAGWAVDRPEAAPTADWLALEVGEPARAHFRTIADDHEVAKVARAAGEILGRIPVPPPEPRELRLLGPAELIIGGRAVDDANWRREKLRSLIGYLVLNPTTTRDAVMTALWPEADEDAARRNLRSTLNLAHKVLEPARASGDATWFIRSDGASMRLMVDEHLRIDALRFDHLLNSADSLLDDGAPSMALPLFVEASALYRGDFLADASYDDWAIAARDLLRSRFVDGTCRAAELLLAANRIDESLAYATKVLDAEPWSERAHRAVIAAHLERGDRTAARRALAACEEALADFGGPADDATQMLSRRLEQ
ncbi:MAG: BTAD domain-containing putative transcriptional regulator [Actinomycetota bacterium]